MLQARYSANGFNITHFYAHQHLLSSLLPVDVATHLPAPAVIALCWLVQSVLALRAALCPANRTKLERALLPLLWGYTYFSSQVDTYQVHMLVSLLASPSFAVFISSHSALSLC